MPKLKVPRKSTAIDMTAMCDVAFLLLSFFIFTAKMKKPTEIEIENPTSVSTDTIAVKNKYNVLINIGPKGEVLVGLDTDSLMRLFAQEIDSVKGLKLTPQEVEAFGKRSSFGMDFNDMKAFLGKAAIGAEVPAQPGIKMPKTGKDTADNQLRDWIDIVGWRLFRKVRNATMQLEDTTKRINDPYATLYINADKKAPWAVVDKVLTTCAKLNLDKFKLITTPEDVPLGSPLEAINKAKAKERLEKIKEENSKQ